MAKAKTDKPVSKGLFDHLKAINETQSPTYFDKLNSADVKTFSVYMINRYLSMEPEYTETINELQPLILANQLPPKLAYQVYISVIPKSRVYLQYIKSKTEDKYSPELVNIVKNYYQISKKEANEYIHMLLKLGKKPELEQLLMKYGFDEKQIKKAMKI